MMLLLVWHGAPIENSCKQATSEDGRDNTATSGADQRHGSTAKRKQQRNRTAAADAGRRLSFSSFLYYVLVVEMLKYKGTKETIAF